MSFSVPSDSPGIAAVRWLRRCFPVLVTTGLVLVVLGVTVLIGWQFNIKDIQSVIPGAARMSPLTAAIFTAYGGVFIGLRFQWRRPALLAGAITTILGLMVLVRLTTHLPFYPEHVLFPKQTKVGGLSISTGINFLMCGIGLLAATLRDRPHRATVRVASLITVMLSLLAIIAYIAGIKHLPDSINFITVAIHTSLGFFIISLALLTVYGQVFRFEIRRRVVWLFFVLGVLTLGTSALAYQNVERLLDAQHELQNRIDAQTALDGILIDTLNVETGQRGYILTGDPQYLTPYTTAYNRVSKDIQRLAQLNQGHPDQQATFKQLLGELGKKNAELVQTIALEQSGQGDEALAIVRTNVGLDYENQIRASISKLQGLETTSYTKSAQAARDNLNRTTLIIVISSIINIALIAVVLQLILQEAAERNQRQRELETNLDTIAKQKAQGDALLSSIGDGVFAVDSKGKVIVFNQAASYISGYKEAEALGKHYTEILKFSFVGNGRPNTAFVKRALSGRKAKMANHTVIEHKNGKLIPVADSAAPIVGITGKVGGAIIVFRDVTQEYAIERAKDEFVSLASHQLRTPATGVKQYVSMLIDGYGGKIDKTQREMLIKAYNSNERQLKIIQDMLNVAHLDAGRMLLEPEPTDLATMLRDVAAEQAATIEERHQTLTLAIPRGTAKIDIDPRRFRMVVENLLSNASKYTPDGGEITLSLKQTAKDIMISVKDNGLGIPEEDIPKLFDKFMRSPNRLSAKVGGSGLGLYLAKSVTELHKGKITVRSTPGKGTTFTIVLPKQPKT